MFKLTKITDHFCILAISLTLSTLAFAGDFAISTSEPGAVISDVTSKTEPKVLGAAPMNFKNLEVGDGKVFLIEKPGYAPVYLPLMSESKKTVSVFVRLHKVSDWTPDDLARKAVNTAEAILDQIIVVQKLLDERKISEALAILEVLRTSYPISISVRLTYANALLLSGDKIRADSLYAALLEEIPENRKNLRDSIELIRTHLKVRSVASQKKEH